MRAKRPDLNLERRRAARLLAAARRALSVDETHERARSIKTLDRGEVPFLEARPDPVERKCREPARRGDLRPLILMRAGRTSDRERERSYRRRDASAGCHSERMPQGKRSGPRFSKATNAPA